MRRPFDGGTIGPSREWKALGPNGEDWRKLAANLLDVAETTSPDDRDLEKILPRIATWTAQPKKTPVVPIAIAAALLLAAGGVGLYFLLRAPTANFDQPTWARLCLDYDSWFGQFLDDVTAEKNRRLFAGNPKYPAQVIAILDAAAKKHDLSSYKPQSLAKSAHTLEDLAVHPTPDAKSGVNAYRTRESLQMVDAVTNALSPGQWPLLTALDNTEKSYRDRGWLKPANAIASLIDAARPPAFSTLPTENAEPPSVDPVNELARINATIDAANAVADIESRWTHIQQGLARLPKTDVPLLQKLPDFAVSVARSPDQPGTLQDVTALAAAFSKIQAVVDQLDTQLNRKDQTLLFDQLAKDPAAQVPPDGPTFDSYAALPALAAQYVKLPTDPRDSVPWQKSLDEIQHDMIAVINDQNPQDPNLPTLRKDHQALITFINNWRDIPPIEKNRQQLTTLVSQARTNLDKLHEEGGTWVAPYIIDPPVDIAQQTDRLAQSPLAKATPVVYNEWKTHQTALIAKAQALGADLKKYQAFKAIDKKFNDLEQAYITLDTQTLPASVPGLSDLAAGPAGGGAAWAKVIATRVATVYRDRALTDLMTNPALKWADDLPQFSDAAYQSYQRQRLQQFDDLRKSTLDLIADYTTIQTRLDHLDLLPNEPTPGAQTWRDLFKKWAGGGDAHSPLLSDETILAALKPITDRVQALLALDTRNDYAPVVADAESPAPELALSAWRKLATIPITEKNPALEDELKIQSHLKDLFSTLTQDKRLTDAHADALRQSLAQALPTRWKTWTDTLSTPETIQWALDHVKDFNVALTAQSNPRMMYNQLLYDLRKSNQQNLKEDQLKPIATTFVTQASALPAAANPLIKGMLANLDKTIHQNAAAEASAAGAGPKLAGWDQDKVKDGVNVFYYPNKASHTLALEFDRVTVGDKQIFLSSTEIPVGVFSDVMNRSGKVAALNDANFPANKQHWLKFPERGNDQWGSVGPRSWRIDLTANTMLLNTDWLYYKIPQMQIDSTNYYSPYPQGAEVPKPTPYAPIQAISPQTAMFFARTLGCRFPTSDEWKTAYAVFEASGTTKDAWNLRGAGTGPNWLADQNYPAHNQHGLAFPDTGIFLEGNLEFDDSVTGPKAIPWSNAALAQFAPSRVSSTSGTYNGSTIWFRDVGHEPGLPTSLGAGYIHDLVGNVAEYVFDGPNAQAPIKDTNVSTDSVDSTLAAAPDKLFVIGGSSLSPPQLPLDKPQPVDLGDDHTNTGFCDVGIRLAYTAPIATLKEVLDGIFQNPPYLPGPNAPKSAP